MSVNREWQTWQRHPSKASVTVTESLEPSLVDSGPLSRTDGAGCPVLNTDAPGLSIFKAQKRKNSFSACISAQYLS